MRATSYDRYMVNVVSKASPVESDTIWYVWFSFHLNSHSKDFNVLNPHSSITSSSLRASITWWNHYLVTKHLMTKNLGSSQEQRNVRQKVLHGLAISRITQTSHSFHLFPKPVQTRSFPTTVSFSCKLALNMKQLVDLWMVPTWWSPNLRSRSFLEIAVIVLPSMAQRVPTTRCRRVS